MYERYVKKYDIENNKTFNTFDFIDAAVTELGNLYIVNLYEI